LSFSSVLLVAGCYGSDDALTEGEGTGAGVSSAVVSELTVAGHYCPTRGEIAGRTIPSDNTYYITSFGGGVDTTARLDARKSLSSSGLGRASFLAKAPAPGTASSRTGLPRREMTWPGSSGRLLGRTARRSLIQTALDRAKATAWLSPRSVGAMTTASPARASIRTDRRRARGLTESLRTGPAPAPLSSSGSR
jgi:hypothetical protein